MKKFICLALLALSGCSLKTRVVPDAPLPFASADYSVLGETTAESCGSYIFGIDFGHLFSTSAGSVPAADPLTMLLGGFGPEESRATYEALGKMPEATNLYSPRFETKANGLLLVGRPIFGRRCATVVAHGVKLGNGPVPNAQ